MEILFAILCLIIAIFPIVWEAREDTLSKKENGEPYDYNKKIEPLLYCLLFTTTMTTLGIILHVIDYTSSWSFINSIIKVSLYYVSLRIMLFDYLHNIYRYKNGLSKELDIFYLGTTASTDRLLKMWGINFLMLAFFRFLVGQIILILAIFL
jgi:hypothetical protein